MISRLFGFGGLTGRRTFLLWVAGIAIFYWGAVHAAFMALPSIASISAPLGLNGGLVLNGIFGLLAVLSLTVTAAITARRLRDSGQRPWLAVLVIPIAAALALWAIPYIGPELAQRIYVSAAGGEGVLRTLFDLVAGGMALAGVAVVGQCLLAPSVDRRAAREKAVG